eukprot:CAMPEP_0167772868 /NCGR_PEP_ID=MMETSP0111_2-20121227/1094_1 /TAXON_ID=91324 /ORGANISM="Lotharella globosa, Strain CCCM811" /LENGTH=56 /DNA_ID=CAMNT_0007662423 /DNA_START=415 /DNA_END=585 /DNA_ORIENTATION=-
MSPIGNIAPMRHEGYPNDNPACALAQSRINDLSRHCVVFSGSNSTTTDHLDSEIHS